MWFRQTAFNLCPFREKSGPKCTKIDLWPIATEKQAFLQISHPAEFAALNWFWIIPKIKKIWRGFLELFSKRPETGLLGPQQRGWFFSKVLDLSIPCHLTSCKKSVESNEWWFVRYKDFFIWSVDYWSLFCTFFKDYYLRNQKFSVYVFS